MSSDFLKSYDLVESTIRKLYDSKLRLAILDALKDGPMRLADLRRAVNANAPNTSAKAKELEGMGMVERVEGDFQLTPYGNAAQERAKESLDFFTAYEKFKDFWGNHDLSVIPAHLLARLGELKESKFAEGAKDDVMESEGAFLEMFKSIRKFCHITCPVYNDIYAEAVESMRKKGVEMEVIVTPSVLKKAIEFLKRKRNSRPWASGIKLFELEDLSIGLGVSERFFTLSLLLKDAKTSYMFIAPDLESTDSRAIRWGLDLFEYYKKQAKPVKLSDYL